MLSIINNISKILKHMRVKDYKINEGFSFYDNEQWTLGNRMDYDKFFLFCKKHNLLIEDKKLYDLCAELYNGIIYYSVFVNAHNSDKTSNIVRKAIYGIMTFVYNRDSSTEHYSEIPTNDELVRLSKDLDIIKHDYHHGNSVNLTGAAKIAKEMLDEYIEYLMDKE